MCNFLHSLVISSLLGQDNLLSSEVWKTLLLAVRLNNPLGVRPIALAPKSYMSIQQWCNNNWHVKTEVLEHFIHHKYYMYCPGIEFRFLWQQTGNKLHEHGLALSQTNDTNLRSEPTNPAIMKAKRVCPLHTKSSDDVDGGPYWWRKDARGNVWWTILGAVPRIWLSNGGTKRQPEQPST